MKNDTTGQALIKQIAAQITCAVCNHHLRASDIELIGKRENVWAMSIHCRECHTKALLLAVVNQGMVRPFETDLVPEDWERFKASPRISIDDVIAVHQFIQSYDGDFSEILEEPLPEE